MLATVRYSLNDIAELANIDKANVSRRFKKYSVEPIAFEKSAGRPTALYSAEVLALFPQLKDLAEKQLHSQNTSIIKVEDEKLNWSNPAKGVPRVLSEEMIRFLADITKREYLEQGAMNNLKRCADNTVADNWELVQADLEKNGTRYIKTTGEARTLEKIQWHFYGACLMRKDNSNAKGVGIALVENWKELWKHKHKVAMMNGSLPTVRYKYLPILEKMGAIGKGYVMLLIFKSSFRISDLSDNRL